VYQLDAHGMRQATKIKRFVMSYPTVSQFCCFLNSNFSIQMHYNPWQM